MLIPLLFHFSLLSPTTISKPCLTCTSFLSGLGPAAGFPNAPYVINAAQEPYTLIAGESQQGPNT